MSDNAAAAKNKLAAFRRRKEVQSTAFVASNEEASRPWPSIQPQRTVIDEVELSTDSDRELGQRKPRYHDDEGANELPDVHNARGIEALVAEKPMASAISDEHIALQDTSPTDEFWANFPRAISISSMYMNHTEQSARYSLCTLEQSHFLTQIVVPFTRGCDRLLRVAARESATLRSSLVEVRQKLHKVGAQRSLLQREVEHSNDHDPSASSPSSELRNYVSVLRQQLEDQQIRHQQELVRANQRRTRERKILEEGYQNQITCLEEQVKLLQSSQENTTRSVSRIRDDIRDIDRSLPREPSVGNRHDSSHTKTRVLNHRKSQLRQSHQNNKLSKPIVASPLRSISPAARGNRSLCPSMNPRHSTVVASLDGSSWRSIYLVVTAQGDCYYGESMSETSVHLCTLNEVTAVRQGSSRHSQRPLLLSITFAYSRQLDIALSDKSEREFWRQAFKVIRTEPSPEQHVVFKPNDQGCNTRFAPDSVASTPSLSSAHPVSGDVDNPTLKKWLESQADNVRRGDFDPDNSSVNNNFDADDGRADSSCDAKQRRTQTTCPPSPAPSRPPLGSSTVRDLGAVATMSTSSRDRLPPLAPQHKRRSTISGSASTADSLTEDDATDVAPCRIVVVNSDEPIAPVSPSHSSSDNSGASSPSSDESIKLSPELSPMVNPGPPQEEIS